MRRLLVLLLVLAVGVGALGYYRGWFTVTTREGDGGVPVDVTVDREKLKEDAERAKAKVKDLTAPGKGKKVETAKESGGE